MKKYRNLVHLIFILVVSVSLIRITFSLVHLKLSTNGPCGSVTCNPSVNQSGTLNKVPEDSTLSYTIKDPVKDYISSNTTPVGSVLLKVMLDIDNDNREDILISESTEENNYSGNVWSVYLKGGNNLYFVIDNKDSSVVFNTSNVFIYDTVPGDTNKSFVTYTHSSADSGTLSWYKVVGDTIIENHKYIESISTETSDLGVYISNRLDPINQVIGVEEVVVTEDLFI